MIEDGQVVYDRIMGEIEPELISSQVHSLEEKYIGETPEENETRKERYNKAFAEFDKRYEEYVEKKEQAVREYAKKMMKAVEENSRSADATELNQLESAISSL